MDPRQSSILHELEKAHTRVRLSSELEIFFPTQWEYLEDDIASCDEGREISS
jgi:hypothetical protein